MESITLEQTVDIKEEGTASITIYWYPTKEMGYWTYKDAGDWDWCGSSSGGGMERRFPEECQIVGSAKYIKEELQIITDYFFNLNNEGFGRYDLHASVYDDKDYSNKIFTSRIIIDNNRSLDSYIFDRPYDPNCKMMNYNFNDGYKKESPAEQGLAQGLALYQKAMH